MLRLSGGQVESLFDLGLPIEVRELPADLAALDRLLEGTALLEPIARGVGSGGARARAADDPDGPLRAADDRQGALGLGL